MIGSRSTKSSTACSTSAGASAELGAARAELGLAAELALGLLTSSAIVCPLQLLVLEQRLQVLALGGELLVLALDLELFEPAQRAQAHVEDRLGLQRR